MSRRLRYSTVADQRPNDVALITENQIFTWKCLEPTVDKSLSFLRLAGVSKGTPVAVLGTRSVETICFLYACLELEATMVLLNPQEPSAVHKEKSESIGALFIDPCSPLEEQAASGFENKVRASPFEQHDIQALIYTSGTTKEPKGVALSHSAIMSAIRASALHLGWLRRDRILLSLPLFHAGGLSVVLRALAAAKPLVLNMQESFDPDHVAYLIREKQVTLSSFVPTMLHRMLANPSWVPPRPLRAVLVGGASMTQELQKEAISRQVPALRTYGMTETFGQIATQTLAQARNCEEHAGAPLRGSAVRTRDGYFEIQSEQLFSFYVERSEGKQDSFIPPSLSDSFFRTEDHGTIQVDGTLYVWGRGDDVAVTGGEKVSLSSLDEKLAKVFGADVAHTCALKDKEWGERIVVAWKSDGNVTEQTIRNFAEQQLLAPERPKGFIEVADFPYTASGKLKRRKLSKLLSGMHHNPCTTQETE